jgi:hypothetical protein
MIRGLRSSAGVSLCCQYKAVKGGEEQKLHHESHDTIMPPFEMTFSWRCLRKALVIGKLSLHDALQNSVLSIGVETGDPFPDMSRMSHTPPLL